MIFFAFLIGVNIDIYRQMLRIIVVQILPFDFAIQSYRPKTVSFYKSVIGLNFGTSIFIIVLARAYATAQYENTMA